MDDANGDELNEYLVAHCYRNLMAASTTTEQSRWFNRMSFYVSKRSPERVRAMEVEKGLAHA